MSNALQYLYVSLTNILIFVMAPIAWVSSIPTANARDFSLLQGNISNLDVKAGKVKSSQAMLWFQNEPKAFAVWAPFGVTYGDSLSFREWLMKANPADKLPEFDDQLSLNCWEFVIYSSLRIASMSRIQARRIYQQKAQGTNLYEIIGTPKGLGKYLIDDSKVNIVWPDQLSAGDIVFMDNSGHVVQFLGTKNAKNQQLVVSFSPRPIWGDGSQELPVPHTYPEITTVESLIEQMIDLYPDVPSDWNQIELRVNRLKTE